MLKYCTTLKIVSRLKVSWRDHADEGQLFDEELQVIRLGSYKNPSPATDASDSGKETMGY